MRQELVNQGQHPIPGLVSHRYRKEPNKWPCYQVGLGVFTVNQIAAGYRWTTFKESIKDAIGIFIDSIDDETMKSIKESGRAQLKYQDVFYPGDNQDLQEFLHTTYEVKLSLPESFLDKNEISDSYGSVRLSTTIETYVPKGVIRVDFYNAIINGKKGLVMDTVVTSKISDRLNLGNVLDELMEWSEQAHDLQEHAFETLVK